MWDSTKTKKRIDKDLEDHKMTTSILENDQTRPQPVTAPAECCAISHEMHSDLLTTSKSMVKNLHRGWLI